jgi:hypothetical protein
MNCFLGIFTHQRIDFIAKKLCIIPTLMFLFLHGPYFAQ